MIRDTNSLAAYDSVRCDTATMRPRVLALVSDSPRTCDEIEAELGMSRLPKPVETCLTCGHDLPVIPSQAETDRSYAKALAHDLRARGEVYSASLVERLQRQSEQQTQTAERRLADLRHSQAVQHQYLNALKELREKTFPWWSDPSNLSRLVAWLAEREEIDTDISGVVAFLAKPWKWAPEWETFEAEQIRGVAEANAADDRRKMMV